jgi:hypothetical protein
MWFIERSSSQRIYNIFHLNAPKTHYIIQGDRISVKGCSVQHVVKILRAFGVEISEGGTIFKRKQTKMVSVDGSESSITVVRGMYTVLGVLCAVSI